MLLCVAMLGTVTLFTYETAQGADKPRIIRDPDKIEEFREQMLPTDDPDMPFEPMDPTMAQPGVPSVEPFQIEEPVPNENQFDEAVMMIEDYIHNLPPEEELIMWPLWETMPPEDKHMFIQEVAEAPPEDKMRIIENRIRVILDHAENMNTEGATPDGMIDPDMNGKNNPDSNIQKILNRDAQNGSPWYKDWEAWGVILAILGACAAIIGYFAQRKKSTVTTGYFKDIDNAYTTFKMKGYRCEAELYRLRDIITEDFKQGNMDENAFQLLDNRIEKYLSEIRENIINEKFGGMPAHLKDSLKNMLESGEITNEEYKKFHGLVDQSTLSAKEKVDLDKIVRDWSEKDT